jgi:AcrB/AcrD/AcrF family protein
MLSLPFALIGGVWAMWLLNYNPSIAVAVGFIALAGVAAETGVAMLLYLDHAWEDVTRDGRKPTLAELVGAIEHGAVNRLRPKLMTADRGTDGRGDGHVHHPYSGRDSRSVLPVAPPRDREDGNVNLTR